MSVNENNVASNSNTDDASVVSLTCTSGNSIEQKNFIIERVVHFATGFADWIVDNVIIEKGNNPLVWMVPFEHNGERGVEWVDTLELFDRYMNSLPDSSNVADHQKD